LQLKIKGEFGACTPKVPNVYDLGDNSQPKSAEFTICVEEHKKYFQP
jgi:hypothetical protein